MPKHRHLVPPRTAEPPPPCIETTHCLGSADVSAFTVSPSSIATGSAVLDG
jgi:hypothetical protein